MQASKSRVQANTDSTGKTRRDVGVALRIDVVRIIEQVFYIYLKANSLGKREKHGSISPSVARQYNGIIDARIHFGAVQNPEPGAQSWQDLIVIP